MAKATKYIFVTGGVLSGVGKGITAASIGNTLKYRGLKVNIQKCDPYLNVDAGTLNPREHGECYVTKDGAETDLDLGHYERFLDEELTQASSLMSGRVLLKVIQDERAGKYQGEDVQIIPHLTGAIQDYIQAAGKDFDVHIVEVGGTVGDYESLSFLEAIREFALRVGRQNCLYVHVVYLPFLSASQESKTKPAQNSVRELRGLGVIPDILVARSEHIVNQKAVVDKLSLFTGVEQKAIALLPNATTIYKVPLTLEDTGIVEVIGHKLQLKMSRPNLKNWRQMVEKAEKNYSQKVSVAVVAKYLDNQDTYMSVFEALRAAAWNNEVGLDIHWVNAEDLERPDADVVDILKQFDGILVPGGFGKRGLEGKIKAAQYAMQHKVPYLGLCLGLQMAVIAAARLGGLSDATTFELEPDGKNLVINTMSDQKGKENTGGTMRLGNYDCQLAKGSLVAKLYGTNKIVERHRHRGECNNAFRKHYEKWGIRASGINLKNDLVEVIEGIDHPFLVASQFHPELKSRPNRPHPLFDGLLKSLKKSNK